MCGTVVMALGFIIITVRKQQLIKHSDMGSIPSCFALECNVGKIINTLLLSPNSIIWHLRKLGSKQANHENQLSWVYDLATSAGAGLRVDG